MIKMELLAPAGNMESLKVAVYNGADAIYLGINEFNARNNIDGFTLDNLANAVDFAHLYNVKVYLALNILFKDTELQSALDIVSEANNIGVDAFIIQDLGLAYLIHKHYPTIELHASTQMAVHNLEGIRVLEKLGFKRVVLSRETSPEEIKRISQNSNMEIEFFTQGALCVGFSGNCYMCSHLVNKSGNRGVCQQFCRLPYKFKCGKVETSGFLLSAKDIAMVDNIEQMANIGVSSLKIEGRARRPFYVAQACRVYRKILDRLTYTDEDLDKLKIAFNRDYTPAYFNGNNNIISKIQGNNGLEIGVVKQVKLGKKFNEVFISSTYPLKGKSGLKFIYNGEELASIGAYDIKPSGNLFRLTTTSNIKTGSKVHIIQDDNLEKDVLSYVRKLPIAIDFFAKPEQNIKITATYDDVSVEVVGEICQSAKTISIDDETILKQLSRSDVFEIVKFNCKVDNCYILNSTINKLRNEVYESLKNEILRKYKKPELSKINIKFSNKTTKSSTKEFEFEVFEDINNIKTCSNLIFDYNTFNIADIKKFDEYCKSNNINGYIDLPNFATGRDVDLIKNSIEDTKLGVVANNIYALTFDCKMIGGQFLNVYNSYTLKVLQELHSLDAVFVEELIDSEIKTLKTDLPLCRREKAYMTLLHCPFKQNLKCECKNCKYAEATYTINSGKIFKIKRKKTTSCIFLLKD